jgi:hypothetical protein
MRVNINLAVHQSAHERYAFYWAPPVTLVALVALAYLSRSAARNFGEYRRVQGSVTECQAQQSLLREREQQALRRLQQPQFQGILRKARYINSLIDRRQLSVTSLTAKLTRLLPADVRVTTLTLSEGSDGPVVRMTIESSGQEKIIAFFQKVEESPDFSDPVISSEDPGQQGAGGAPAGVTRMVCTASYKGWQSAETEGSQKAESGDQKSGVSDQKPEAGTKKSQEPIAKRQ